jgi:hypothetical protein
VSATALRVSSVNGGFAYWLEASGLNKKEFARRVQARAHAKGLRHVSTAASRVRGWLAGQQPTEPGVAQIVADVLSEACRRPVTIEDIGFRVSAARRRSDPAELAVIPGLAESLSSQSRTDLIVTSRDVRAEEADTASGDALLDAVEHIALGQPALVPDLFSLPRLGTLHVAQIEQTTNAFRRWDNEFGSGMRRKAVVGQLNEAAELLRGPFQDDRVARRLFSAVADLAQLAGWMSYDLQLHATAQRYFLLGMHLAKDAGDRPQVGRMLYCLARQMIDLQRYREALDLAQTGVYAIRRSSTPKTMALLHVIEARAHAGMGQTGTVPERSAPPRMPSPGRARTPTPPGAPSSTRASCTVCSVSRSATWPWQTPTMHAVMLRTPGSGSSRRSSSGHGTSSAAGSWTWTAWLSSTYCSASLKLRAKRPLRQ